MKSLFAFVFSVLVSTVIFAQVDCANITITGRTGQINVSGLSGAPIAGIQVFNSSWATVFNQTYSNPANSITVPSITAGQYFVNVRVLNANWSTICEKGGNASVTAPPPPPDTCIPTFQKFFGTVSGGQYGYDITKIADGGFIVVGRHKQTTFATFDALVMKIDSTGNIIWSFTLGGSEDDLLNCVKPTSDGGFIASGTTESTNTLYGDSWVIRFTASGNILWQKKYSTPPNFIYITEIIQTSDGGFAMSGNLLISPPSLDDWAVIKTDANGNIQWQKNVGNSINDVPNGLLEDSHGSPGIVVVGYYQTGSGSHLNGNLTKFDFTTGNILWTKSYDLEGRDNYFNRIFKVSDGFVLPSFHYDTDQSTRLHEIVKTDFDGNLISVKEIKVPGCPYGTMEVSPNGDIVLVAGENPGAQFTDIHLLRIDPAGNVVWAEKFPRPNQQWGNKVIIDGNKIMGIGFCDTANLQDQHVLLFKSDWNGKIGSCNAVSETINTRIPTLSNVSFTWDRNLNLNQPVNSLNFATFPLALQTTTMCFDSCVAPPHVISISNPTVNESAGNATLQICISAPASDSLRYHFTTGNVTAISGSDYTEVTSTVVIAPGETCGLISIPILNDAVSEATENFTVFIGSVTGTVTIIDDDQPQNNCDGVTINAVNNQINITGLSAPVITVQIFNSSWATVFNQSYTNSPGTVNIPIGPGLYHVKVTFYTSGWSFICDKNQDVTVVNQCPAGTICISNTCPSQTVNLNTAYSIPNLPPGTTVSWHTGTPATDGNKMTAAQAQNVSVSGTYYAAINISGANCYSQTIPVNVTIIQCTSPATVNAIEFKSEGKSATRKITVFPNPFTSSVRVIIDSEKKERATMMFTDLMGRQLQRKTIQLVPGSNSVMLEGLDKYPSGNYFLQIASPEGVKSFKLIRQQ